MKSIGLRFYWITVSICCLIGWQNVQCGNGAHQNLIAHSIPQGLLSSAVEEASLSLDEIKELPDHDHFNSLEEISDQKQSTLIDQQIDHRIQLDGPGLIDQELQKDNSGSPGRVASREKNQARTTPDFSSSPNLERARLEKQEVQPESDEVTPGPTDTSKLSSKMKEEISETDDSGKNIVFGTKVNDIIDQGYSKKNDEITQPPFFDKTEEKSIEFHFENTDLQNLVTQISEIFQITFITNDSLDPFPQNANTKPIKGNKISFKTQQPLSKKEAWDLFITFLDIAGLAAIPQANPKFYRIVSVKKSYTSPVPTHIGIDPESLPDNDEVIRYVYFIENSPISTIENIVNMLKSSEALAQILQETKALIITDKAYNIKMLMKVVQELDRVTMPQSMSVLKLKRTDAQEIKELYNKLSESDDKSISSRLFPARKQPTSRYFPENTRIIAEPRTNTLILLGPQDAIKKIENFIVKYIDIDLDKPYSPLYVYDLKYADANSVAEIMTKVTAFGKGTEAGKSGGVRDNDKYLKPISFHAETETNRLVVKGEYDDYLRAVKIIEQLDEPQPQVAIEVLILSLDLNDTKELGAQIRSKEPGINGLLGDNVKFQTSGFLGANGKARGIEENPEGFGVKRLLGNLINLVKGTGAGNTILTLGEDALGVWGVFKVLKTVANTQVVSNPFLTATNKQPATVSLGRRRRVVTATVVGGASTDTSKGNEDANLEVKITPQINSDGMIILDVEIKFDQFIFSDPESPDKTTKEIVTKTIVANKEVLALGGIIQNRIESAASKTPLLADIPLLGWLFKNKRKQQSKSNLLILISSQIIHPDAQKDVDKFTQDRWDDYDGTLAQMREASDSYDPIHRLFFAATEGETETALDNFLLKRRGRRKKTHKKNIVKNKRKKNHKKYKQKENIEKLIPQTITTFAPDTQSEIPEMLHNQGRVSLTDIQPRQKGGVEG